MIVAFNKNELKDGTKRKFTEYSNDLETRVKNEFDYIDGSFIKDRGIPNNDLNDITQPGVYTTDGNTLNSPIAWGIVLHTQHGNTAGQILVRVQYRPEIHFRGRTGSVWTDWKSIT